MFQGVTERQTISMKIYAQCYFHRTPIDVNESFQMGNVI